MPFMEVILMTVVMILYNFDRGHWWPHKMHLGPTKSLTNRNKDPKILKYIVILVGACVKSDTPFYDTVELVMFYHPLVPVILWSSVM